MDSNWSKGGLFNLTSISVNNDGYRYGYQFTGQGYGGSGYGKNTISVQIKLDNVVKNPTNQHVKGSSAGFFVLLKRIASGTPDVAEIAILNNIFPVLGISALAGTLIQITASMNGTFRNIRFRSNKSTLHANLYGLYSEIRPWYGHSAGGPENFAADTVDGTESLEMTSVAAPYHGNIEYETNWLGSEFQEGMPGGA